ncbi:fasciclin domain-containing protein [Horticoccus sp. 23ND18S-11]|uniref:fasciclin domain-containing protein n=1 Tax=Horticoccus sp. 23ND18S-11 TaxID=3391832 RepID=UPI0039C9896D
MKSFRPVVAALSLVLASAATAQTSSLVNNSTRGVAGSGANAMISGFVVNAPAGQLRWVLIRGVGPTLSTFGVASPLADPAIQVTASGGTVIGVNDNVATAPNLPLLNTVSAGVGAFPLTSANDAALLIGVPAGAYTVQLHTNAATEARPALLEVYEFGAVAPNGVSQSISGLAASNANLSTLATALRITGLDATLSAGGPFTVFAPTNAAFAALPPATLNSLLANPAQLAQVLLFHVASGQVLSSQLTNGQNVTTLRTGARPLVVNLTGGVKIDAANVVAADVRGLNGVVHVIDSVLLP